MVSLRAIPDVLEEGDFKCYNEKTSQEARLPIYLVDNISNSSSTLLNSRVLPEYTHFWPSRLLSAPDAERNRRIRLFGSQPVPG